MGPIGGGWAFRAINVSMWAWCTQLEYYSESEVREYLDVMPSLERSYPQVKFVYFTGNAQATGEAGYKRHLRNEQIRNTAGRITRSFLISRTLTPGTAMSRRHIFTTV